jgi:hypothetical protein
LRLTRPGSRGPLREAHESFAGWLDAHVLDERGAPRARAARERLFKHTFVFFADVVLAAVYDTNLLRVAYSFGAGMPLGALAVGLVGYRAVPAFAAPLVRRLAGPVLLRVFDNEAGRQCITGGDAISADELDRIGLVADYDAARAEAAADHGRRAGGGVEDGGRGSAGHGRHSG